ncbi:hypothetical protein GC176_17805 [bacterium]|nr:hypothetical protein [bacterium]
MDLHETDRLNRPNLRTALIAAIAALVLLNGYFSAVSHGEPPESAEIESSALQPDGSLKWSKLTLTGKTFRDDPRTRFVVIVICLALGGFPFAGGVMVLFHESAKKFDTKTVILAISVLSLGLLTLSGVVWAWSYKPQPSLYITVNEQGITNHFTGERVPWGEVHKISFKSASRDIVVRGASHYHESIEVKTSSDEIFVWEGIGSAAEWVYAVRQFAPIVVITSQHTTYEGPAPFPIKKPGAVSESYTPPSSISSEIRKDVEPGKHYSIWLADDSPVKHADSCPEIHFLSKPTVSSLPFHIKVQMTVVDPTNKQELQFVAVSRVVAGDTIQGEYEPRSSELKYPLDGINGTHPVSIFLVANESDGIEQSISNVIEHEIQFGTSDNQLDDVQLHRISLIKQVDDGQLIEPPDIRGLTSFLFDTGVGPDPAETKVDAFRLRRDRQLAAAELLGKCGEAAIPAIPDLLRAASTDSRMRDVASASVVSITKDAPIAIRKLIEVLESIDPASYLPKSAYYGDEAQRMRQTIELVEVARQAIGVVADNDARQLETASISESSVCRAEIALSFMHVNSNDSSVVKTMSWLLDDKEWHVRKNAIKSLESRPDRARLLIPELMAALDRETPLELSTKELDALTSALERRGAYLARAPQVLSAAKTLASLGWRAKGSDNVMLRIADRWDLIEFGDGKLLSPNALRETAKSLLKIDTIPEVGRLPELVDYRVRSARVAVSNADALIHNCELLVGWSNGAAPTEKQLVDIVEFMSLQAGAGVFVTFTFLEREEDGDGERIEKPLALIEKLGDGPAVVDSYQNPLVNAADPDQPDPSEMRTWTNRFGTLSNVATFVEYRRGIVKLKGKDGTEFDVRYRDLSQGDRDYVMKRAMQKESPEK